MNQENLRGRTALLVGNGPSSWDLPERLQGLRDRDRSLVVVGINERGIRLGADIVAAVDMDPIREIVTRLPRQALRSSIAYWFSPSSAREVSMAGYAFPDDIWEPLFWSRNTCSGTAAFVELLLRGCRRIVLVGFDGPVDLRSRDEALPYYTKADTSSFRRWAAQMATWARAVDESDSEPLSVFHVFRGDLRGEGEAHPIAEIPSVRVDSVEEAVVEWSEADASG